MPIEAFATTLNKVGVCWGDVFWWSNVVICDALLMLLQYYKVLQRTTPVLLRTTKYCASTSLYYEVLRLYYKLLLQQAFFSLTEQAWVLARARSQSATTYDIVSGTTYDYSVDAVPQQHTPTAHHDTCIAHRSKHKASSTRISLGQPPIVSVLEVAWVPCSATV